MLTPQLRCACTSVVPSDAARLPESECAADGAQQQQAPRGAALFYNHRRVDESGCRVANVPLRRDAFSVHYNEHNAAFDEAAGVMTLKMDGSSGVRLTTTDGRHLYGVFQVAARVDGSSGAVTAFYTRSSDDYNADNHGAFDEIDFEFVNGNPGVPGGLWLNSFRNGLSGGERLVRPAEYRAKLGLGAEQDVTSDFLTYTIDWQPDHVAWHADGALLLRRAYDDAVAWRDMRGTPFSRRYRPPAEPSKVTFSMWADERGVFGGALARERSPFVSRFRELRRVLCDEPPRGAGANGPTWATPAPLPAPSTPQQPTLERGAKPQAAAAQGANKHKA